jgi:hypothetical protein
VASLKRKGDIAELRVAADLAARGCHVLFPFGEDCDYDLAADYEGRLHRVQVKYTQSDGRVIVVRCRSHSLTKGKIRRTKFYTAAMVDWVAVFDVTSDLCYYVPSWVLGADGVSDLRLRLVPGRNGQLLRIRPAEGYLDPDFSRDPSVEPTGIEPVTSSVQGMRSAS